MKRPFYLNNVSYVTVTKFRLFQVLYSISALKDPELRFFLSKDPVLQGKKYGSVWKSSGNLYSVHCTSTLIYADRYRTCCFRKNTFSVL